MAKKQYKSFQDIPKQQAYISPSTVPKKSKVNWHDKYVEWKDKAIFREEEIKKLKEDNQLNIDRVYQQNKHELDQLNQKIRMLKQQIANRDILDKHLTYYLKRSSVFNRAEVQYLEDTWFPNLDVVGKYTNFANDEDPKENQNITLTQLYMERGLSAESEAINLFESSGIIKWSDQSSQPSDRTKWPLDKTRPRIDRGAMDLWFSRLPNGQQNVAVDIKHHRLKAMWGSNYAGGLPRGHGVTINYGTLSNYIDYLDYYNIAVGYLWWIKPKEYEYWNNIGQYAEYLIDVRQVYSGVKNNKLDMVMASEEIKKSYEHPYYVEIPFNKSSISCGYEITNESWSLQNLQRVASFVQR